MRHNRGGTHRGFGVVERPTEECEVVKIIAISSFFKSFQHILEKLNEKKYMFESMKSYNAIMDSKD